MGTDRCSGQKGGERGGKRGGKRDIEVGAGAGGSRPLSPTGYLKNSAPGRSHPPLADDRTIHPHLRRPLPVQCGVNARIACKGFLARHNGAFAKKKGDAKELLDQ